MNEIGKLIFSAAVIIFSIFESWAVHDDRYWGTDLQKLQYKIYDNRRITLANSTMALDTPGSDSPGGDDSARRVIELFERKVDHFIGSVSPLILAIFAFLQWRVYRQQSQSDLVGRRAFMTFKGLEIRFDEWCDNSNGYHKVQIGVIWGNDGATATKWAVARSSMQIVADSTTGWDPDVISYADLGDHAPVPLTLGGHTLQSAHSLRAGFEHPEIFTRNHKLYIWGWIEYNDLFERDNRYRTEYCNVINIYIDHDNPKRVIGVASGYGRFNGAEDECLKKHQTYGGPFDAQKWLKAHKPPADPPNIITVAKNI